MSREPTLVHSGLMVSTDLIEAEALSAFEPYGRGPQGQEGNYRGYSHVESLRAWAQTLAKVTLDEEESQSAGCRDSSWMH